MRIALIKLFNIGDALLLTPTLDALRRAHPGAEVTVVTRETNLGILAGCPVADRLVGMSDPRLRRPGAFGRDLRAVLSLRRTRFDFLFELGGRERGRNLAALCRARRAYTARTEKPPEFLQRRRFDAMASHDGARGHAVERDFFTVHEFLPLPLPIPPLVFSRERAAAWPPAEGLEDFALLHVSAREGFKRWHADGWAATAKRLLDRFPRLVVSTGPAAEETAEAETLRAQFGEKVLLTRGRASWPELAGLLYRAALYVGLDTSVMHLAAACGCPIVAVWGPTREEHWAPWRARHRIVAPRGEDPLEPSRRKTVDVAAADVIAACDELLAAS
ncbi:MAG: glycosyltransferase family 9 protein [Verrucomicrobiae bacterium]|nr:glycosyltransferase family 9 protein [Verrucomicrobiae bacterium]